MYDQLSLLFIFFLLYSIIGWICEVIFCSIHFKKLTNRGFLNGPYCPIYGIGALLIVFFLMPYISNPLLVFIMGVLLTSTLEYLTSWGMEKIFHARWWDYSENQFNIKGRICLLNSLLFGVLCLFLIYVMHPFFSHLLNDLDPFWRKLIASITAFIFLADIVESIRQAVSFNQKLKSFHNTATTFMDALREKGITTANDISTKVRSICDGTMIDVKESAQNLYASLNKQIAEPKPINRYSYRRIMNAFPKMAHYYYQNALEIYHVFEDKHKIKEDKHKIKKDRLPNDSLPDDSSQK